MISCSIVNLGSYPHRLVCRPQQQQEEEGHPPRDIHNHETIFALPPLPLLLLQSVPAINQDLDLIVAIIIIIIIITVGRVRRLVNIINIVNIARNTDIALVVVIVVVVVPVAVVE
jgi:hypothetical protein